VPVTIKFEVDTENRQIHGAYEAQKVLISFFHKYKEHLEKEEYKEIIDLLSV